MTISLFALAEASLAQVATADGLKKAPRNRVAKALADRKLAPEPR